MTEDNFKQVSENALANALLQRLETDRPTPVSKSRVEVLVKVAKIDNRLQQLLKELLLPSLADDDDLLDEGRPIGTFQLRAKLAARLGLIGPIMYSSLKELGRIRNICAHKDEDIDVFKLNEVNSKVNEIWGRVNKTFKTGKDGKLKSLNPEQKFNEICSLVLLTLSVGVRPSPITVKTQEILFSTD